MDETKTERHIKATDFVTATEIARQLGCDRRRIKRLLWAIEHQLEPCPIQVIVINGRRLYKEFKTVCYLRDKM